MARFRTILPPIAFDFSISHQDDILSLGSCFAEHIGTRLAQFKFVSHLNPFGILYNPLSIADGLEYLLSKKEFTTSDIFLYQDLWHSFRHHGTFSHPDQTIMVQQLNEHLNAARAFLDKMTCLIITLGTANAFVHKKSNRVVANCHKLPGDHFYRKMLEPAEIIERLGPVLNQLKVKRPDLNVLLTVSPVRHIRDGLMHNNRSKARLLLVAEQLSDNLDWVHYFPAYELVMDDLRDYRFFNDDLIHPSDLAIDYVWSYFADTFFSPQTVQLLRQIGKLIKASKHRPFHSKSSAHQAFIQKQLSEIDKLEMAHSNLNFQQERQIFETLLINRP